MSPRNQAPEPTPKFDLAACQILVKNGHSVTGVGLTMPDHTQTRLFEKAELDLEKPAFPKQFLKDADPEAGINLAILFGETPVKRVQSYLALCSNCLNGRNGTCPRLEPAVLNNGKNGGKKAQNERHSALVFRQTPEV
jgi:hypothetical protein